MDTALILPMLTAFGMGSIITVGVQFWLNAKLERDTRSFKERREAYLGLLEAYHRAAVEGTDEAAKNFAYWQMRCEIVSPSAVRDAIAKIVETNGLGEERFMAHERLKEEMRRDLKIING